MLFHITQTHTPETCPVDEGGSTVLYDPTVEGIKLRGMYGAFSEHVIYFVVEADRLDAVHKFLLPGFKRSTSRITPVKEEALTP
jgi:hypothetical protein